MPDQITISEDEPAQPPAPARSDSSEPSASRRAHSPPREIGGPKGPEPTRYGDWEKNGRCIDF